MLLINKFSTLIPTRTNFILPRGFSFNLAFLIWCIASTVLLEAWDSLVMQAIMTPGYGAVNTRMDLISRNMTLGLVIMYHHISYILTT